MLLPFINNILDIPGVYIAGGACKDHFLGVTNSKDIDVYVKDHDATSLVVGRLYKLGYTIKSFKSSTYTKPGCTPVQLISYKKFNSLQDVLDDFDLKCCRFGWSKETGFVKDKDAIKDATNKVLRIHKISNPVPMLKHIEKYITYGYKPAKSFWKDVYCGIKLYEHTEDEVAYEGD